MNKVNLDDYVTVAERVGAFFEKYPEGTIQTELLELTDSRVVVRASAFRTPDDIRPGTGHAAMGIPGSTPYTRGSELENTETSAVGRALALLGFGTQRGLASAEEIRSKQQGSTETSQTEERGGNRTPFGPLPSGPGRPSARNAAVNVPGELTLGQSLEIIRKHDIEAKHVSNKGRELYGEWQLKAMTGEQRAHVVEELLAERNLTLAPEPDED